MKKVTGQLVMKARYKPNQTPIRDNPTETAIIFGTEWTIYFAVAAGRVKSTKTSREPTICAPMLTLKARVIKKVIESNLVLSPAACAPM